MEVNDLILDQQNDLQIEHGDLLIGESAEQHQMLLLSCNKGEFKQSPDRCVGVVNYLEQADHGNLCREIHTEFSKDGMKVQKIQVNLPNIEIIAEYQ